MSVGEYMRLEYGKELEEAKNKKVRNVYFLVTGKNNKDYFVFTGNNGSIIGILEKSDEDHRWL